MYPKEPADSPAEFNLYEFGGTEEELTKRYKGYIKYFKGSHLPILDIGCGRGIMLSLLKENNIAGYGIDLAEQSVTICRRKGLEVIPDNALNHLIKLKDASLGGIFAAHIIEHLDPQTAFKIIRECARVLVPGGPLVLITPNPRDLTVMTKNFWLDITHVRPYPAELLASMLRQAGFRNIELSLVRDQSFANLIKNIILSVWFLGLLTRGDVQAIGYK